MDGSATRRNLTAAAVVAAIALAYVRVASVEPAAQPQPTYTWRSAVDEVRTDFEATADWIRREHDERKAILIQMSYDLRVLDETLSGQGYRPPGQ